MDKQSVNSLALPNPMHFRAVIPAVAEPRVVADWVVGAPFANERDATHEFEFAGNEKPLTAMLVEAAQLTPVENDPARWVAEHGTFRPMDWTTVSRAKQLDLPPPVRKEIASRHFSLDSSKVYLLSIPDMRQELEVLRAMTQIAGAVRQKEWAKGVQQAVEPLSKESRWKQALGVSTLPTLTQQAEWRVRTEFNRVMAWDRVEHHGQLQVQLELQFVLKFNAEPALSIMSRSVLQTLYCSLLTNFKKPWARCRRQSCQKPFIAQRGGEYCSFACYHADYMSDYAKKPRKQTRRGSGRKKA